MQIVSLPFVPFDEANQFRNMKINMFLFSPIKLIQAPNKLLSSFQIRCPFLFSLADNFVHSHRGIFCPSPTYFLEVSTPERKLTIKPTFI